MLSWPCTLCKLRSSPAPQLCVHVQAALAPHEHALNNLSMHITFSRPSRQRSPRWTTHSPMLLKPRAAGVALVLPNMQAPRRRKQPETLGGTLHTARWQPLQASNNCIADMEKRARRRLRRSPCGQLRGIVAMAARTQAAMHALQAWQLIGQAHEKIARPDSRCDGDMKVKEGCVRSSFSAEPG